MGASIEREASVDRSTIRATEGERVSLWIDYVKADKREQHEHFVHDLLMPATEKVDTPVFRHTRYLHPSRQNEDGTWTFAWLFDPPLEGGDYNMSSLLAKAYGEEKSKEHLQLWKDSIVRRVNYNFTQSPW